MYFWKAKALARDLKENKVSEKQQMVYFLLLGIAASLPGDYYMSWLERAIYITGGVLGTIWCFQANQRGDNQDFIARMTCLSVPVFVRLAVFAEIIGVVIYVVGILIARFFFNIPFAELRAFSTHIPSLVLPIIAVAYFATLRHYLLYASGARATAENPTLPT